MTIIESQVFINSIPVEFGNPFEIRPFHRGLEPWQSHIPVSDFRFDNLPREIELKIITHGVDVETAEELVLKKWIIINKIAHDQMVDLEGNETYKSFLVVADYREEISYNVFTKSYNVTYAGAPDKHRTGSLNAGRPWLAIDAIEDACKLLGMSIIRDPLLSSEITSKVLPDNLGNSPYGGWFAAKLYELRPMFESIRCDLRPNADGTFSVIDRRTNNIEGLRSTYGSISGATWPKLNKWEAPTNIEVHIQKRIEQRFEYNEPLTPLTATSSNPGVSLTLELDNVIPEYKATNPGGEASDHVFIFPEVLAKVGMDGEEIADKVGKDQMFPWRSLNFQRTRLIDGAGYDKFRWFETFIPECWRQRFRVKEGAFKIDDIIRPFADIQLGRIDKDGTTKTNEHISMNYVRRFRYGHFSQGSGPEAGGGIYDQKFSENVPYVEGQIAPFLAEWMSEDPGELIFNVQPRAGQGLDKEYYPGALKIDVEYFFDLHDIIQFDYSKEFTTDFEMDVYYHGVLVENIASQGELGNRELKISLPSEIPGAIGPTLKLSLHHITANYAYDGTFPGVGLNASDVVNEARATVEQAKTTYSQIPQGSLVFSGIAPCKEFVTGGNIYDIVITVGAGKEYEIITSYLVAPEVRPVVGGKIKDIEGLAPRLTS